MNMNSVNLVIRPAKSVGCGYIGWTVSKAMACTGSREYGLIGAG